MTQTRDLAQFHAQAIATVAAAAASAALAPDAENALRAIARAIHGLLGDKQAHLRPGALRDGERQYAVAGVFLLSRSGAENLLVAEVGFPKEQHRLRIPSDLGHPGWMVREQRPLLLANTDDHQEFKQILKTSRMGSAIFAPLKWQGCFIGTLLTASQARHTYSQPDLNALIAFANLAALAYAALGGDEFRNALAQT